MDFVKALTIKFGKFLEEDVSQEMELKRLEGGGFIACKNVAISMYRKKRRDGQLINVEVDPDHIPCGGVEIRVQIRRMLCDLSPLEVYIAEGLAAGTNKTAIAKALGVPPATISRVVKVMSEKCKKHL